LSNKQVYLITILLDNFPIFKQKTCYSAIAFDNLLVDVRIKCFSVSGINLPSSPEAKGAFKDLLTTLRLDRSNSRTARPKDIETKTVALHEIVSSLFIDLKMTEGRYCSRTIKRSSFTGKDLGRDVFDAVIRRLEEHGYIKFERGRRQACSGHLSRVYLKRPLVRLFKEAGVTPDNIPGHVTKRTRHSIWSNRSW
jgi:hypothetical protein